MDQGRWTWKSHCHILSTCKFGVPGKIISIVRLRWSKCKPAVCSCVWRPPSPHDGAGTASMGLMGYNRTRANTHIRANCMQNTTTTTKKELSTYVLLEEEEQGPGTGSPPSCRRRARRSRRWIGRGREMVAGVHALVLMVGVKCWNLSGASKRRIWSRRTGVRSYRQHRPGLRGLILLIFVYLLLLNQHFVTYLLRNT